MARAATFEKAVADFDQSIKLDPRNALAFYNRGLTLRNRGRSGLKKDGPLAIAASIAPSVTVSADAGFLY